MAEELNPEISETGESAQKRSAWLIDDSAPMCDAISRAIGIFTNESMEITSFQEGINVLREFDRILQENDTRPELILMDYNLTLEAPEAAYETGVEVIIELKRIAEKYQTTVPEIIAFSSSARSNQELLAAGATSAIDKSKLNAIKDFFTERANK